MAAWNGWYHLMANTYGTWPPGDPRGFRTRHHREHVEGDYRQPSQAGKYDDRLARSRALMTREPVVLAPAARLAAVEALVYALREVHGLEVLVCAVGAKHLHLLVRLPDEAPSPKPTPSRRGLPGRHPAQGDPPRYYLGIAKERSSKALAEAGLVAPGGIWAKRGKIVPVRDREHQVEVVGYLVDHLAEGAAVWDFIHGVRMHAR